MATTRIAVKKFDNIKFFPKDWRGDMNLRACSLAARGLWIEMICLMHEAQPYGHLTIDEKRITPEKLAKLVGDDAETVEQLLGELREQQVFSETERGVIYSRRMVKDNKKRVDGSRGGRGGGGSPLLAQGRLGEEMPAPEARPEPEQPVDENALAPLNPNFTPSEREILWAKGQADGVNAKFLDWQTEKFIDYWTDEDDGKKRRRPKKTADGWRRAWRAWIGNSIFRYGELDSYLNGSTRGGRRAAPPEDRGSAPKSRADKHRNVRDIASDPK